MPHVGKKAYPYTKKGVQAAKVAAKATGMPMVMKPSANDKKQMQKMVKAKMK